ncbi:HIV Tat-specific factor 1 homolog [Lutzomyia longipalpis]|uniref:HIV Tat-specific factor 1 homolog n=1 Tax=Lutzomyia longipalpis TaxID=7200 RepID=UPI0024832F5D|nr:HIV Tat-specific factor 1 homolog [Lutzomyia longipalpis]
MSDLRVVDEGAVEAGAAAESPGREIVVSPEEALSVREESKVEANEGAGSAQLGGSCEEFVGQKGESLSAEGGGVLSESADLGAKKTMNEEYAKHVVRDESGAAIYVDPSTKLKYRWDEGANEWVLQQHEEEASTQPGNPYETEHYRWCTEKGEWVLKEEKLENEYYTWSSERGEWVPKEGVSAAGKSYVDKDGVRYAWDAEKSAWFPAIDEDFMAHYQMNYGFVANTADEPKGAAVDPPPPPAPAAAPSAPVAEETGDPKAGIKRKAPQQPPKWFDLPPEHNTKVYVSNLPEDITEEEFVGVMSKCGMIMRDIQTQKLKVKLYAEADGQLKGDGLCDYIKVESVDLALNILDGYEIRGRKLRVERAEFHMRGEYNPALKPKRRKKDKEKVKKMKEKLFDWRPDKMRGERARHERVVTVKNLFTPETFDKEVQLILEYQNDLREECKKCGTVRKVIIYDRHPEGVAQVTMADPDEADLVVKLLHGRFFGQKKLTAELWDGKTKYKIVETEEEALERKKKWDTYLEQKEKQKEDDDSD